MDSQITTRRLALQLALAIIPTILPVVQALASDRSNVTDDGKKPMDELILALDLIGTPNCKDAANILRGYGPNLISFNLHLRNAGLRAQDAQVLAEAMRNTSQAQKLRSFSVSFNPNLTDFGIATLIASLPTTVIELGLVGCSMGDVGGAAILKWAQHAHAPSMICIEQNNISTNLRQKFTYLQNQRPGLTVII